MPETTNKHISHNSARTLYVYNDYGVSPNALTHTLHTLKSIADDYKIALINAKDIACKAWTKDAILLIMPGGADVPYTEKLNGIGNARIKEYVENGGNYLGLCAGSYYGAGFVAFDKNGPLEVVGTRELGFFPDTAIGPLLAPYDYKTNSGARAAILHLNTSLIQQPLLPATFPVYYNGGGYFNNAQAYKHVDVIAYYEPQNKNMLPAILKIKHKKGTVVLSGVHFEYSYKLLEHDIYHNAIIPILKKHENHRILFTKAVLNLFGIKGIFQ